MNNIFFSADTHIGHRNILRYMVGRPYSSEPDTFAHDQWLIDLWQRTIDKTDRIYFAGDLTFYKSTEAKQLLERLPGEKYLAPGNHDASIKAHSKYFKKVAQIMEITLKSSVCDFLKEDLKILMSHYPLLDWSGKHQGTVMLHGHCHGTLDEYNGQSSDLRFDVGIDGALSKQAGGFIDIRTLYDAIIKKTGGLTPQCYAEKIYL